MRGLACDTRSGQEHRSRVVDRHGLVNRARKGNRVDNAVTAQPSQAVRPAIYARSRQERVQSRQLLPLMATDQASRNLLACKALEATREAPVIEAFVRLFGDAACRPP